MFSLHAIHEGCGRMRSASVRLSTYFHLVVEILNGPYAMVKKIIALSSYSGETLQFNICCPPRVPLLSKCAQTLPYRSIESEPCF